MATTGDGNKIVSDVKKPEPGSAGADPQPVYLLLAALVGCEQSTAAWVAKKMDIKLDRLEFDLAAWRDTRGVLATPIPSLSDDEPSIPSMVQSISGTVLVHAAPGTTQEQVDVLAKETNKRCPVASMIKESGCKVDVKWTLAPPQAA